MGFTWRVARINHYDPLTGFYGVMTICSPRFETVWIWLVKVPLMGVFNSAVFSLFSSCTCVAAGRISEDNLLVLHPGNI